MVMVHWIKNYISFLFVAFSQIPLNFLFQQLCIEIQTSQQYLGSSSAQAASQDLTSPYSLHKKNIKNKKIKKNKSIWQHSSNTFMKSFEMGIPA